MKVFENNFVSISIEEKDNLYAEKWKPASKDMTGEEWKTTRIKLKDIILQYKSDKILSLAKELYLAITPELQEWMAKNVSERIAHLIKKTAITVPEDLVSELGVNQLMEEGVTEQVITKYFDNENEARKWLIN